MTNLILHFSGDSRDTGEYIYEHLPSKTVIKENIPNHELISLIQNHDRIIVIGHGTSKGLYGNQGTNLVLDSTHASFLREKPNSIYIWCQSNVYAKIHKLKGLCTGKYILRHQQHPEFTEEQIDEANTFLAQTLSNYLDVSLETALMKMKELSIDLRKTNPALDYNLTCLSYNS